MEISLDGPAVTSRASVRHRRSLKTFLSPRRGGPPEHRPPSRPHRHVSRSSHAGHGWRAGSWETRWRLVDPGGAQGPLSGLSQAGGHAGGFRPRRGRGRNCLREGEAGAAGQHPGQGGCQAPGPSALSAWQFPRLRLLWETDRVTVQNHPFFWVRTGGFGTHLLISSPMESREFFDSIFAFSAVSCF